MASLSLPYAASPAFRFLLAGGLAAAINWVSRFPLSWVMPFGASVLVAQAIGLVAGFALYRAFVFAGGGGSLGRQIGLFLAVNLVSGGVVWLVAMTLLAGLSGLPLPLSAAEGLAHGMAIAAGAVSNYFGHRFLTFRPAPRYS